MTNTLPRDQRLKIVGMMRFFVGPVDKTVRILVEIVAAMWRELTPEQKARVLKSLDPKMTADSDN
jgi:hypothetical protein